MIMKSMLQLSSNDKNIVIWYCLKVGGVGSKLSQGSLAVSLVCKDHTFGSNIERISTLEN